MSCNNGFREYLNQVALLQACRRDAYVKMQGICVLAMLPTNTEGDKKTDYNYFGDMCADNRVDENRTLLPLYNDYYTLLDVIGEDHEDPLPLECLTISTEYWPRDTLFKLPVLIDGELKDRYWRVISDNQKHLDVVYNKKIKCVPARDSWIEGIV